MGEVTLTSFILAGATCLGKIGSVIGKPLYVVECATKKLRMSYARILVEVDITMKQTYHMMIKDSDGKLIKQMVEFQWKPKYCGTCLKSGHDCQNEIGKSSNIWHEKKPKAETIPKAVEGKKLDVVLTSTVKPPWTQVGSSGRGKGKADIVDAVNSYIDFSSLNGFNTLGVGRILVVVFHEYFLECQGDE